MRSLEFVDRLIVAVATNSSKQPLFTLEERVAFIRSAVGDDPRVEVRQFDGLLVDFARDGGREPHHPRPARGERFRVRVSRWRS